MYLLRNRGILKASFNQDPILGSGLDGVVLNGSGNINIYTHAVSNIPQGSSYIVVQDSSYINKYDEILIHQTQSANSSGTYEFAYVRMVSGNTIYIFGNTKNSYVTGVFNSNSASATQIIRVPNYESFVITGTVSGKAWDGFSGGIVVAKSQTSIVLNSNISMDGRGYRRGSWPSSRAFGTNGESWNGIGVLSQSRNNGGSGGPNAGASGLRWPSGGGGGAYSANGGNGGVGASSPNSNGGCTGSARVAGQGGVAYGTANLSTLHFGSGSGGSCSCDCGGHTVAIGATGGGAVMLFADTITISGNRSVSVRGNNGVNARGASGGAAGGAALFKAKSSFSNSGAVRIAGGSPGVGQYSGSDGSAGAGSAGRAAIYSPQITRGFFDTVPFESSL